MESAPWPEELQLPPPRDFDPYPRLSGEVRTALAAFVDAVNARLEARKGTSQRDVQGLEPLGPRDLAYVEEALETLQYSQGEIWTPFEWGHVGLSTHKLLTDASSFEPIQLIRLLILTHDLGGRAGITWQAEAILADYRKDRADEIGLRELAQLFEIAGLDSALVARTYLDSWTNRSLRWGPEATWPFFAERLDALSTALRERLSRAPPVASADSDPTASLRASMSSETRSPTARQTLSTPSTAFPVCRRLSRNSFGESQ